MACFVDINVSQGIHRGVHFIDRWKQDVLLEKKVWGGIFSGGELRISPFWYQRLTICLNAV